MDILDQIRLDYQRFPHDQSYHLYVDDLYFEDPLNKFRGVDRYRRMIDFISRWFKNVDLQLHDITIRQPHPNQHPVEILNPATDAEDRSGSAAALVLFGLPATGLGSWLILNLRQQHQRSLEDLADQQEQRFLQLLQDQRGDLTVIQFATATQLSLEEAKAYLDQKAKLLDASFDVSKTGAVVYRFPV